MEMTLLSELADMIIVYGFAAFIGGAAVHFLCDMICRIVEGIRRKRAEKTE